MASSASTGKAHGKSAKAQQDDKGGRRRTGAVQLDGRERELLRDFSVLDFIKKYTPSMKVMIQASKLIFFTCVFMGFVCVFFL